ncbi:MATE family efflux transporter [Pontibacter sp. BT310]|uniref:Multidrug-efflux transporter n=1 Tax=Pontibacter populi TaxID=890055 RepID=A0ABS6XAP4_9BACT|nr:MULTISPECIES: MATE family efflux transporter [Pontibacter]MBJ6118129.1 MATE family efflux transporter [Pontibacter sp. BT310]MBR0570556.1 MATE family efflux transporter [Microvirga sp. STS03]MBW3364982.1 MATE family efflux transporter [Pontibacter populi]
MSANKLNEYLYLVWSAIKGKEYDYTTLGIRRSIVLLAIPMILEMLMESLFAVVDIFFVGRLGSDALATVGLTESIMMLIYAVGMGISIAATAMVSRRFGEKNYRKAGSITFQLLITGTGLAVLLGGTALYFTTEILSLMGASAEVIATGANYARIIFAGNFAIILLFLINGAFRGAGLPHLAMRALWIANAFNIVLDPLLIFGLGPVPGLGLDGAAWATTIGRSIGVLYQLYHLFNGKHSLKILRENLVVRVRVIIKILKLSSGGIGQYLIDSASWIFLTRIIAEFGSQALAGYTIAFRIIIFTLLPAWGLSSAAATLVGQNLGAQKAKRAEVAVWLTARYNVIFMAIIMVAFLLFGKQLSAFFSDDAVVISISSEALKIITLGYIFFGLGMVMVQAFNGAGDTRTPALINIGVLWLIEIPTAYTLAILLNMEATGIFIAIAFCHSLHALVSWWFFRQGNWKITKV